MVCWLIVWSTMFSLAGQAVDTPKALQEEEGVSATQPPAGRGDSYQPGNQPPKQREALPGLIKSPDYLLPTP